MQAHKILVLITYAQMPTINAHVDIRQSKAGLSTCQDSPESSLLADVISALPHTIWPVLSQTSLCIFPLTLDQ